ncbi:MAG: ABC transporter permease, partial [Candidatus Aminicenantes bacterium]|nr:ABC transporter permease [Candidatus Aminicenantes bacterium]
MKKSARYIIALFIILSLNFLIPRFMPGDPVTNLMGEDFLIDQETLTQLKKELGLDQPLIVQYGRYWKDIFRLDLGYSYHFHEKVTGLVFAKAKWTVLLVGIAILLGSLLGGLLGAFSGWVPNTAANKTATSLFLAVYSTPPFFLSLALLYVFAYKLGLFPLRGFYET